MVVDRGIVRWFSFVETELLYGLGPDLGRIPDLVQEPRSHYLRRIQSCTEFR